MNLIGQDPDCLISYAAGYFDGEGCIWVTGISNGNFLLKIRVLTTDEESVRLFYELFGNLFTVAYKTKTGRQLYRWQADGESALHILNVLLPFLRAKRKQAQAVVESGWKKQSPHYRCPPEQLEIRKNLMNKLRNLRSVQI